MFNNNGPVAAMNSIRSYISMNGINAFPEEARDHIQQINTMGVFEILTTGVERLFAMFLELDNMPGETTGLNALGEAAQAAAISQLEGKADRWWSISQWAATQLSPPPEGVPVPEAPEVRTEYSYNQPEPEEPVEGIA